MAKSGMNPKTLQYLMGHSDIGVTMNTYTHVKEDDAKEELEKMGLISKKNNIIKIAKQYVCYYIKCQFGTTISYGNLIEIILAIYANLYTHVTEKARFYREERQFVCVSI